ncbi:MAG: efflux RND transporter permease subunit, partial [Myxococcota bacterium]
VVDDAIVVLENITRWVEKGHPPLEAARKGMAEISFAVVSATISAVAVFLPLTFLTDTTGRLFREFAVTVASALLVSGFVAITLSPALCGRVLRPRGEGHQETGIKKKLGEFVERLSAGYGRLLHPVLQRPGLWVAGAFAWVALGAVLITGIRIGDFDLLPAIQEELIPKSDRNVFFAVTVAPEGSTIDYTDRYQAQVEEIVLAQPEIRRVFSVIALGIGTPGFVNRGLVIGGLSDAWERERSAEDILDDLRPELDAVAGIEAYTQTPPAIGGFLSSPVAMVIEGDRLEALAEYADEIKSRLNDVPGIMHSTHNLDLNKPQLEIQIDRERASDLGVSVRDVATTLQILMGGMDLSTFKLEGETYDVMVQVDRSDRDDPRDMLQFTVRGNENNLISLSSVIRQEETIAPREIPHYNRRRSVTISSNLEDDGALSQGQAIAVAGQIAREVLPERGYQIRWTGEAEKFLESGNAIAFAYGLAIVVVFLVLAAQFESFVHPVTILVAVALSFTGALIALKATGTTLNLFSKIGLVMLVGLVTKNSILIVEFANQLRGRGLTVRDAVEQAARTRFRPILMTALATMMGILPIALGRGAGGDARAPLGIAVVGGMFFSTILTFFIVPATYIVIDRAVGALRGRAKPAASAPPTSAPAPGGGS